MSIPEEVKRLASEQRRPPWQPEMPGGVDDATIAAFEERTGVVVPGSLREWLQFSNGPQIGVAGTLGIETRHPMSNIERYYQDDMFPKWREMGWIPIGSDGFGNYYVITTREDEGPGNPVFFVDCVTDPDGSRPTYVVASDVWHFLRFYIRDRLGENGWPFERNKVLAEDPALADYSAVPRPWEVKD